MSTEISTAGDCTVTPFVSGAAALRSGHGRLS
jgi:hypothetical protein